MSLYAPPAFFRFVKTRFHLLFWPLLAGTFLLGFMQAKDQTYLQNERAPKGIVSLELGSTRAIDSAIVAGWKNDTLDKTSFDECREGPIYINRLKKARTNVHNDFLFILFYTALAIVIIAGLQTRQNKGKAWTTSLLLLLAILAGVGDLIEDRGLLRFIAEGFGGSRDSPTDSLAQLTRLMALIKFGILGFLLLIYIPFTLLFRDNALRWLSDYIREKSLQLFRYRVILVSVIFFTIPIWVMDQGQDLLVNSNASDAGVFLFMTVVLVAAALNWWLSKLFFEKNYKAPVFPFTEPQITDPTVLAAEKKVSRYLGIATIIIPATAILNALNALRIHFPMDIFPPILWLIALLAIFYVLVKYDIACRLYTWTEKKFNPTACRVFVKALLFILAFLLPVLLRFTLLGSQGEAPSSLIWLFGHLVLLATAFWLFVSTRNNVFAPNGFLGRKIGWPIILLSAILVAGFLLFNAFPLVILDLDCNYLSLPLLLSGIIFYILLFTLLIRISLRTKINFVLFIVVAALIISATAPSDYHSVDTVTPKSAGSLRSTDPPPALDKYFKGWILARQAEIEHAPGTYPVFLVNTYGGGIKAAAFTNMALSWLDATLIRNSRNHKGFDHYVFSLSGASGGTIGAAVQCAYRANHLDRDAAAYHLDSFRNFYKHDFLTPILGSMFGRDMLASVVPGAGWDDRSAVQEHIWTGFGQSALGIDLGLDFNAIWDTAASNPARYEVPLLFSNTLNVDDGLKGIMTAVTLPKQDFPGTIFINDRIMSLRQQHKKDKDSALSISLSTGAFLSARFPFISPSGKMGAGYHFMDGGGKDNSGASTSEAIFLSLARTACRCKDGPDSSFARLMKKVRFYFVSITNSPYYDPDTRKLVANRFEPVSPLVGIVNSGIYGNAQAADEILKYRYASDSTQFQGISPDYSTIWITGACISDGKSGLFKPVLPLGWQISAPSLERLRRSFDQDMLSSYNAVGAPKILKIMAGL